MSTTIECKFCFDKCDNNLYTCKVENQSIQSNEEDLLFNGNHSHRMTDEDVEAVDFYNCKIKIFPQLKKIFPNLKQLNMNRTFIKRITREDLKQYTKLTHLYLNSNEIEFLPGDLLTDIKKLEVISFYNSGIKVIEPNFFNELSSNLNYLNLLGNPCIDKYFDASYSESSTLDEIKQEIHDKFSSAPWKTVFKELKLSKKEIKHNDDDDSISDDLKRIVQNKKLKDFTVRVEGEEFKVHKLVLAARSSVLLEMIESKIDAVSLNIDSVSTDTFRVILNFMYTDKLPESNNIDFIDLFTATDRLKIEKLKKFAAEKLIEKINAENAFKMLIFANKFKHKELRRKSFEEIKKILGNENIDEELAKQTERLKEVLELKATRDKIDAKMQAALRIN